MSHLELMSGCKKRKRGEKMFRFKTFGENGYPIEFNGSFRENVKELLEFGYCESSICSGIPSWSFQLEVSCQPPFHILLFVIEEPIDASIDQHCKHCLYVGWGHHLICNKKYHFVLPSKDTVIAILNCQGKFDGAISMKGKLNIVELQGHMMHGVFHSNGFAHLLCVNGMEAGSNLAGRQIMEFWDRLCTGLRARKVSLTDISQKRSMELRLLYGIAYGEPWFGQWSYKFERGSFGVTGPIYHKAIQTIQSMPLCLLLHYLTNTNHDLSGIMSRYQTLSDFSLATLGDLFHFMFELKSRLPEETCIESYSTGIAMEPTCRWSPKRIEMATRVIVEALKRADFRWVSRQEVRDAARAYIGDTGLLDFVLKSLGNRIVGNYLVRRSLNPVTKVLEYCLEDVSNVFPAQESLSTNNSKLKGRYKITKSQVMKDMYYFYKYILKDQKNTLNLGIFTAIQAAARVILDTKFLAKDYHIELPSRVELGLGEKLKLYCTIVLRNSIEASDEGIINKTMPPFECITLKANATFDELKQEVERNFSELYWGLRGFVSESMLNLNAAGTDLVFGLVDVGQKIILEGSTSERGMISELICESGLNSRTIDCPCGTKDDDGERMVSCDICEVWQHTRCVRIPNHQEIPHIFLCRRCEHEIIISPSLP
ncbi:PHD finger protein MALE STERILITY 1 [Mercurialis annua]|uniref:PHD finger protein MALE STERILITY 1 n=1 Tax=Mercurialis annua TaxID=3986 RepID=UPI00215E6A38|nr:PHD finger protein MALE STERILITY 1 [Mercurialis annua]